MWRWEGVCRMPRRSHPWCARLHSVLIFIASPSFQIYGASKGTIECQGYRIHNVLVFMHGVLVYSSSFCRRKSRAPPQLLDTIFNLIPTYWAPHLVSSSPRLVAAILFWIVTMVNILGFCNQKQANISLVVSSR